MSITLLLVLVGIVLIGLIILTAYSLKAQKVVRTGAAWAVTILVALTATVVFLLSVVLSALLYGLGTICIAISDALAKATARGSDKVEAFVNEFPKRFS